MQPRQDRHNTSAISKCLSENTYDLVRKVLNCSHSTAARVADAVQAAARVTLANRLSPDVYWYGPDTVLTLARSDLDILFEEADTLAQTLGDDAPPDTERSLAEEPWHGLEEPTINESGRDPSDD